MKRNQTKQTIHFSQAQWICARFFLGLVNYWVGRMACFGHVWYYFSLVFFCSIISVQFSLHAIANEIRNLGRLLLLTPCFFILVSILFRLYAYSIALCRFLCTNCVFLIFDRWTMIIYRQIDNFVSHEWNFWCPNNGYCFAYFLISCLLETASIIITSKSHLLFISLFVIPNFFFAYFVAFAVRCINTQLQFGWLLYTFRWIQLLRLEWQFYQHVILAGYLL